MQAETADTIAAVGSKATYAGAATSFLGWIGVNEIVAIGGFLLAVGGFAVNWYYRHLADKRDLERHRLEMKRLLGDDSGE